MEVFEMLLRAGLLLAAGSGLASAQSVFVVDHAGGAGSTHTTIAAAIAAASDGDSLLVRDGQYAEELLLDGKGVHVQAEAGAVVRVTKTTVRNLAASQAATIRGVGWIDTSAVRLELTANAGPVWIEEADGPGGGILPFTWWGGKIEDSATAVLRNCRLGGPPGLFGAPLPNPGLHALGSRLAAYECDVAGQRASVAGSGVEGGPGLLVEDSDVFLYASTATGGQGSDESPGSSARRGGPGAKLLSGLLDRIRSPLVGGDPGFGSAPQGPPSAVCGGTLVNHPSSTDRIFTIPSPLRSAEPTTLTFTGAPGELALLMVAPVPGTVQSLAFALGPLVLPSNPVILTMGTIPASGTLTLNGVTPTVASDVATYYMQALYVSGPPLRISLGTATVVQVFDPAF